MLKWGEKQKLNYNKGNAKYFKTGKSAYHLEERLQKNSGY